MHRSTRLKNNSENLNTTIIITLVNRQTLGFQMLNIVPRIKLSGFSWFDAGISGAISSFKWPVIFPLPNKTDISQFQLAHMQILWHFTWLDTLNIHTRHTSQGWNMFGQSCPDGFFSSKSECGNSLLFAILGNTEGERLWSRWPLCAP